MLLPPGGVGCRRIILAWLVIEVIGRCDLSAVLDCYRRGGPGRQAYDPQMLATLLVYAYCQGCGRRGEDREACRSDVAFMVVAGQQRQDHWTLSRFRAGYGEALAGLSGQVLRVAPRRMGRVGVVAVDGTKIAANASSRQSRTAAAVAEAGG